MSDEDTETTAEPEETVYGPDGFTPIGLEPPF